MTLVDPNILEPMLEQWRQDVEDVIFDKGIHVGDIEDYKLLRMIFQGKEVFGLCTETEVACLFGGVFKDFPKHPNCLVVSSLITKASFRGKNLSYKVLHFFQTREHWTVVRSNRISPANKKNLEKIAASGQTCAYWLNVKTGEIVEFNDNEGKYQLSAKHPETNWRIAFMGASLPSKLNEDNELIYMSRFWQTPRSLGMRMFSGYENEFIQGTD